MRAFLRDRRRLHQPAVDMPIDLGKRVHIRCDNTGVMMGADSFLPCGV